MTDRRENVSDFIRRELHPADRRSLPSSRRALPPPPPPSPPPDRRESVSEFIRKARTPKLSQAPPETFWSRATGGLRDLYRGKPAGRMHPADIADAQIRLEARQKLVRDTDAEGKTIYRPRFKEEYMREVLPESEFERLAGRYGKGVFRGALGTLEGMAGALEYLTDGAVGRDLGNTAKQWANDLTPEEMGLGDHLASGLGSSLTYFVPGLGVVKGVSALAKVAPRVALLLGTGTTSAIDSVTEAGLVYRNKVEQTHSLEEADRAAGYTFWLNMPLSVVTNMLGVFSPVQHMGKRMLFSGGTQSVQEATQTVIEKTAMGEEVKLKDLVIPAVVGGFTGTTLGAASTPAIRSLFNPDGHIPAGSTGETDVTGGSSPPPSMPPTRSEIMAEGEIAKQEYIERNRAQWEAPPQEAPPVQPSAVESVPSSSSIAPDTQPVEVSQPVEAKAPAKKKRDVAELFDKWDATEDGTPAFVRNKVERLFAQGGESAVHDLYNSNDTISRYAEHHLERLQEAETQAEPVPPAPVEAPKQAVESVSAHAVPVAPLTPDAPPEFSPAPPPAAKPEAVPLETAPDVAPEMPLAPMQQTAKQVAKRQRSKRQAAPEAVPDVAPEMPQAAPADVEQRQDLPIYKVTESGQIETAARGYAAQLFDETEPASDRDAPAAAPAYSPKDGTLPEVRSEPIGTWESSRDKINDLEDAAVIARDNLGRDAQEVMVAIVTDADGNILSINQHAVGGVNMTVVYPNILAGQALNTPGASNLYLIHNHPSGVALLSSADDAVRDTIADLLDQSHIEVAPAVAVGRTEYGTKIGTFPLPAQEPPQHTINVNGRKFTEPAEGLRALLNPDNLRSFGREHMPDGGIVLLSSQNEPLAVIRTSDFGKLRPQHLDILREAERRNASGFIAYAEKAVVSDYQINNLVAFSRRTGLGFVTVLDSRADHNKGIEYFLKRTESEKSATFTSGVDVTQTLKALRGLRDDIKEAMPHLEALGRRAYQAGAVRLSEWRRAMMDTLGDLWASFKGAIPEVWAKIKGQRGGYPLAEKSVGSENLADLDDVTLQDIQRETKEMTLDSLGGQQVYEAGVKLLNKLRPNEANPNVKVLKGPKEGMGLIRGLVGSPSGITGRAHYYAVHGKNGMRRQERLAGMAKDKVKEIYKPLRTKELKQEFDDLEWLGDVEGRNYAADELAAMGVSEVVAENYLKHRRFHDQVWRLLRAHRKSFGYNVEGMTGIEGHIPHRFENWNVYEMTQTEDGTPVLGGIVGTFRNLREATSYANSLNPQQDYIIKPKVFSLPDEILAKTTLRDASYFKMVERVEDTFSLTREEAKEMVSGVARRTNRHRYLGNLMRRKGQTGYKKDDLQKILTEYYNGVARYIAMDNFKARVVPKFERDFGVEFGRADQAVRDKVTAQYVQEYINDVNGVPGMLENLMDSAVKRAFGDRVGSARPTIWTVNKLVHATAVCKLGLFNMSAGVVNLTQLFNAFTKLPPEDFAWAFGKVIGQHFGTLTAGEKNLLRRIGVEFDLGLADSGGYATSHMGGKVTQASMYFFSKAEYLNRAITALGAYRHATRGLGMDRKAARLYAREIVDKTQFDYTVADTGRIFRNPAGRLLGQFKPFGIKQIEFITDLKGAEHIKFWTPFLLLSSYLAVPMIEGFSEMVEWMTGVNPVLEYKNFLMEWAGDDPAKKKVARIAMYGLSSLAGVDVSRRVGTGDIIPHRATDLLGPTLSTLVNAKQSLELGDKSELVKNVAPSIGKFIQAIEAIQNDMEVASPYQRDRLRYKATPGDIVTTMVGLRPVREAEISDVEKIRKYRTMRYTKKEQGYIDEAVAAIHAGDGEKLVSVIEKAVEQGIAINSKAIENEILQKALPQEIRMLLKTRAPLRSGHMDLIDYLNADKK